MTVLIGIVWKVDVVAQVSVIRVDVDNADIVVGYRSDFKITLSASHGDLSIDVCDENIIASQEFGFTSGFRICVRGISIN